MENTKLYPLNFYPLFKSKVWGGSKIQDVLGKQNDLSGRCGESWEISTVPGNISRVASGHLKGFPLDLLIRTFKEKLVGNKIYEKHKKNFPLLFKFIDAQEDLSIQVHPDDELAMARHNSLGKTEMWYILEAGDKASIINGFNTRLDEQSFSGISSNAMDSIFNRQQVQAGDVVFIPAGTVYAIGAGILLAEIQQSSDVTYRIHDYNRSDLNGNRRELHLDLAKEAIDYGIDQGHNVFSSIYSAPKLVECDYFTTNHLTPEHTVLRDYSQIDSFVVYMIIDGDAMLKYHGGEVEVHKGDVYLIPASMEYTIIDPLSRVKLLEVHC
ncbi:MAG: class I mannose-6-phosphate isomerase [Cytophagales bacterium]|nr:class I mannose-6-phosphate isomerase [Cytophagales bacterium]